MGGARVLIKLIETPDERRKTTRKQISNPFRNYISFAGAVIVTAAVVSILLLFLIELTQTSDNPYLGIVTYVILPCVPHLRSCS